MSNIFTDPQAALSTSTLTEALRQQTEYLIRQFGKLVSLASSNDTSSPPESPSDGDEATAATQGSITSLPSAAVQTYGIAAETQAFISSIESLTVLTRRLKEAWVFGELETVGASRAVEERTEHIAREIVADLMKSSEGLAGN